MRFFSLFLLLFIISPYHVISQEKNEIIQQRIEFIVEQSGDEEQDFTTFFESLNEFYIHPINLNKATTEELELLGLLDEFQIQDLILHVELYGKLISIYELQSLKYWDLSIIELVLPFVKVEDKLDQVHTGFKEIIREGKFESFMRIQSTVQSKAGYDKDKLIANNNSYYLGNKAHYFSRLRYTYRSNLSIGITGDKDSGEEFFHGSQSKGFDFYSMHAFYKGGKYIRSVAVGDYQIQIGQGLALWIGFAPGKSSDVMNVKKSANTIRPFTSSDEVHFLRGSAVDLAYKNTSLTFFASRKKIDGSLSIDTLSGQDNSFLSINTSGLHRTLTELENKGTVTETITGTNLRQQIKNLRFGFTAIYQAYDCLFLKESKCYNIYDFRGDNTITLSSDYNWIFRNINVFGEISRSSFSGKYAHIHGMLISLDPRISFSLVYRNFDKAYHSFYTNGFSESGHVQNEKGVFIGSKIKINKAVIMNIYTDFYSFPWLKYQVTAPSIGYEILAQLTYKPNKELEIYGRYKMSLKQKDSRDFDGTIFNVEDVIQRNYRLNIIFKISNVLTLKSRLEFVTIQRPSNNPEKGLTLIQDLSYQPLSGPFDISLRYALFQTDSYDSRIYSYEANALYVYSIPAYFYQGSKTYCMIRYSFLRNFDVWIRYGSSVFSNRNSIGTGLDEIKGNVKSDFTIQFRARF